MKPKQQAEIVKHLVSQQLIKQGQQIKEQVVKAMMAATLLTLHDKYHWKAPELVKVMTQIFEKFEAVADKYVTIEDFYEVCRELGIEIKDA